MSDCDHSGPVYIDTSIVDGVAIAVSHCGDCDQFLGIGFDGGRMVGAT